MERHLTDRIRRDVETGALPADTDAAALAATVVCTVQGFSALARDGASADKLDAIAAVVPRAWP